MKILIHMGDPYLIDNPCTKRMRAFRDEFVANGYDVSIMAPKTAGVQVVDYVTYCPTIPLKKKTTIYRLLNSLCFAISSIFCSIGLGKVDVVITTCPPPLINMAGWFIAKIKGAKLIYDVRDVWPDVALEMGNLSDASLYCRVFEFIRNFMLKHSDLTVAVSPGKVKKLQGYLETCDCADVLNGFDNKFLDNKVNPVIIDKFSASDKFKCVYIGNLGLAQGLRQLLYIAQSAQKANLPTEFYLYGSGAEENELKQFVIDNELNNVYFEGRLPNSDMYSVLKCVDISFVSLVNGNLKDSVPTKLYEALGVGCPVLLSAEGDSADILCESTLGVAVKPNDENELWNGFMELYENIERYRRNASYAQHLMITKYSRQTASMKMMREIEKLLLKK